jgi:hypothetical protein
LHSLYNRRERLRGLIPISFAEPDAFDGPICVETRLGRLPLHDNADKRFTAGIGFLDRFGDRRLQVLKRDRTTVIERSLLPKPSQNAPRNIVNWTGHYRMIAGWEGERRAESRRQIDQISDRSKCKLVTLRVNSSVKQNFVSRRLQASAVDARSQVLAAGEVCDALNEAAD